MDSLADEPWDLVIAGTGLPQALLALSLSRSDLKILHVDIHSYYGGDDAGLSLEEAERWAAGHNVSSSKLSVVSPPQSHYSDQLGPSRAYTLSLNPQIIYASSSFLPALVTSRIHNQLDFLAVGSFYILEDRELRKIPSSREDVFADDSLSRRDKIGLMKLLRYVTQEDDQTSEAENEIHVTEEATLKDVLESKFRIPSALQAPISALALSNRSTGATSFATAVSRIRRHLKSLNYFGPGFAAVYPKYAGSAEVAQVACRAGAVGGAVYLLGHGVASIESSTPDDDLISLTLSNGTTIKTRKIVGMDGDLPLTDAEGPHLNPPPRRQLRSISIVSDPLKHLFAQTADNGPVPAVAIVSVEDELSNGSPIYLQIHSEDTGECPTGQCCVYASTILGEQDIGAAENRLVSAVTSLLGANAESADQGDDHGQQAAGNRKILWSMAYTSSDTTPKTASNRTDAATATSHIMTFSRRVQDITFDDSILSDVKSVWRMILGDDADDNRFLVFEERNSEED